MQTLTYKVNFAPEGIPTTVRLSQNENGRSLQFAFIGDRITIPDGSVVTISGTKPDGHVYSAEGTLDGDVATFDEEIQMTAAAGEWAAKLKVTHNGLTVATQRLWMIIDADTALPGSVPSESELNGLVAEAQQYAENARSAAYGSPLTATLAADMLDTSRVYVYTGSETGMIFGHWYYYEDGEWEDGGVYQSQGVQTDTTLSITGMPADAGAAGTALDGKVNAEAGKGLSSNDFTTAEKTKLAGIADQATRVLVDSTLKVSGMAADSKIVGDEIDGLKEDLNEKGLSDNAKAALLACFAKVAWIDEHGQDYYDALETALYPNEYPKITAVFNPGANVIYTDDALDTLKQYLTVKYYTDNTDTGTVISAANYTLAGVLQDGESIIRVSYLDYKTTFVVNAVDFYEIDERVYPNDLMILSGSAGIGQQGGIGYEPVYNGTVSPAVRASFWVSKGRNGQLSVYDTKTAQRMDDVFAIPVPTNATVARCTITPSTYYVNIRRYLYNRATGNWETVQSETGWQQGTGSLDIPASEYDRYISISSKFNSGGTSGDLPTGLTLTFE